MKKITKTQLRKPKSSPIILSPVKVPPMKGQAFVEAFSKGLKKF